MDERKKRVLIRNLLIEVVVYGTLAVVYSVAVLRLLGGLLASLFHDNLAIYALVGLGLILVQGVLLDTVTSFLLERFGLGRLE